MTKNDILKKVEDLIIEENPALSDPDFRKRLDPVSKQALVQTMIQMALMLAAQYGVSL